MHSFASAPEFACDDFDDLMSAPFYSSPVPAPRVDPVPSGFVPLYVKQREAFAADLGFLALVAPDLFAWRVSGTSLAQHHATGMPQPIDSDQDAAARSRRHREYCDGFRIRPLEAQ